MTRMDLTDAPEARAAIKAGNPTAFSNCRGDPLPEPSQPVGPVGKVVGFVLVAAGGLFAVSCVVRLALWVF